MYRPPTKPMLNTHRSHPSRLEAFGLLRRILQRPEPLLRLVVRLQAQRQQRRAGHLHAPSRLRAGRKPLGKCRENEGNPGKMEENHRKMMVFPEKHERIWEFRHAKTIGKSGCVGKTWWFFRNMMDFLPREMEVAHPDVADFKSILIACGICRITNWWHEITRLFWALGWSLPATVPRDGKSRCETVKARMMLLV